MLISMHNVPAVLKNEPGNAINETLTVRAVEQESGCVFHRTFGILDGYEKYLKLWRRLMCGILGYFRKSAGTDDQLGATVLNMLEALGRRGPDSAGVALVGPSQQAAYIVRVKAGDELEMTEQAIAANRQLIKNFASALNGVRDLSSSDVYVRFVLTGDVDLPALTLDIETLADGIEVLSIGHAMELSKEVGTPHLLEGKHHISSFAGTHGIGHTRLCTESVVDLSHSQPFWGRGAADVAIVHNGHITNYHQLRRKYEQRGVRFMTENDSEVLAVYLAEALNKGATLREGLNGVLRDMDGAFSCLAVTATEMGFVKDPYAFKPLVMAETDDFVAVATEEIAIRSAIPGNYKVSEAQVEEVRVWSR
jgi:methylamine---glutamate N-methyltransferase subunit A